MAADIAPAVVTGLKVQAIGDAHVSNFGVFASPDRRLVFDVNDFDETLPAPWEWDVKRLVASVAVAGLDNKMGKAEALAAAGRAATVYRMSMAQFAAAANLDVWYAHIDVEDLAAQQSTKKGAAAIDSSSLRCARRPERTSSASWPRSSTGSSVSRACRRSLSSA